MVPKPNLVGIVKSRKLEEKIFEKTSPTATRAVQSAQKFPANFFPSLVCKFRSFGPRQRTFGKFFLQATERTFPFHRVNDVIIGKFSRFVGALDNRQKRICVVVCEVIKKKRKKFFFYSSVYFVQGQV